jgi:hypothetical protein
MRNASGAHSVRRQSEYLQPVLCPRSTTAPAARARDKLAGVNARVNAVRAARPVGCEFRHERMNPPQQKPESLPNRGSG